MGNRVSDLVKCSLAVVALAGCSHEPAPTASGPAAAPIRLDRDPVADSTPPVATAPVAPPAPIDPCPRPPPAPTGGAPPVPAPNKIDLGATPDNVRAILEEHHAHNPCVTELHDLGTTHQGRPILALAIGRGGAGDRKKPAVLLNGAHHGNEPLSATFVLDAIRHLLSRQGRDAQVDRWLDEFTIWCVPMVNPDGLNQFRVTRRSGRKNGRDNDGDGKHEPDEGVDLNRNYPFRWGALREGGSSSRMTQRSYRGPSAASEPETRAMIRLAESERFVAAISYHVGTAVVIAPYTIDHLVNPTPNEAWTVAAELARQMPPHPDVPKSQPFQLIRKLYSVDGTDQDWHRAMHGTVALLIEGAGRAVAASELRADAVTSIRSSWMFLLDRYLGGPSIEGRITDTEGRPIVAEVQFAEIRMAQGESWTSRCRDGLYARYLSAPGRYTVIVKAEGAAPVERVVEVGASRVRVDFEIAGATKAHTACPSIKPPG